MGVDHFVLNTERSIYNKKDWAWVTFLSSAELFRTLHFQQQKAHLQDYNGWSLGAVQAGPRAHGSSVSVWAWCWFSGPHRRFPDRNRGSGPWLPLTLVYLTLTELWTHIFSDSVMWHKEGGCGWMWHQPKQQSDDNIVQKLKFKAAKTKQMWVTSTPSRDLLWWCPGFCCSSQSNHVWIPRAVLDVHISKPSAHLDMEAVIFLVYVSK